ncbi:MAG: hypothetical protein JOZ62_15925, partial [Acidobacteriaceae bacterium]|nr:hypothetical protein [Acidobacteriaceae bacterium]
VEANSAPAAGHRDPAPVKMTNVRETPSAEARFSRPRFRYIVGAAVLAGVIVVPVAWVRVAPRTHSSSASASETWVGSTTAPIPQEVRVLTGYHGGPVTDDEGHSWTPDAYYAGGISKAIPPEHFIEAEAHPHLLKAQRSGQFRYDIPLQPGNYELHLYFAETEYGRGNLGGGGEGTRMFQVSINGLLRLRELDPLAEAGAPNRMHERVFKDIAPASDGKLHLSFDPANAPAFLNAIEILPSPPGRIRPVRIVAQANALTDSQGHAWAADGYFCGGTPVFRQNFVISPPEKALYRGERYGNFSYHIPLAPGKYRLSLHFAEQWFGTAESGLPLRGSRIFNVFANGVTLLRNFQIVEDAGGPNRGVTKVFNNLEPNAQGMLLLDFVPVKNYAEVNAIEVVENE